MQKDRTVPSEIEIPGDWATLPDGYRQPVWPLVRVWLRQHVALISVVSSVVGAVIGASLTARAQVGYRSQTPAAIDSTQDKRLDSHDAGFRQLVPLVEALSRLQCIEKRPSADAAGLPCPRLLDGRGIMQSSQATPRDGTHTIARWVAPTSGRHP